MAGTAWLGSIPLGVYCPKRRSRRPPTDWTTNMCRQTTCRNCKKATWAGCGQHKNEVLRGIPKNQRCSCTQAEKDASKGFFAKLFGG